jgi:hypothetical protein
MKREVVLVLFVVFAGILRVIPHPPNFAPVTALALFSGVYFRNKTLGILIPVTSMILSDLILGFYSISYWVYGSFILVSIFGMVFRKINFKSIVLSSLIFFFFSNLGVWVLGYPKTLEGFLTCYYLAIPFFGYSILGNLFYSVVLKNSLNYIENTWPTTSY